MASIETLQKEIEEIKARNRRVEKDKDWELSWTRKIVILLLTYAVIAIFLFATKLPNPLINAIIPSIAFVLSTSSVNIVKKWWIKSRRGNYKSE